VPLPPGPRIRPLDWGFERPKLGTPRRVQQLHTHQLVESSPPPVLSQLGHDTGFDEVACAPTCMVMAGIAWGVIPRTASVRAAIMAAGRWGSTSRAGTTVEGLGKIAEGMDIDFEQRPYVTAAGVRELLDAGAHVIVRGNSFVLPWSDPPDEPDDFSSHVVLVTRQDDQGRFVVHDPYVTDGEPRTLTAEALEHFGEAKDNRDRPFIMGVAKMRSGLECRTYHDRRPR
jgi:hypothetical protein